MFPVLAEVLAIEPLAPGSILCPLNPKIGLRLTRTWRLLQLRGQFCFASG